MLPTGFHKGDFLPCLWCDAEMTNVWLEHAVVVKDNLMIGPAGRKDLPLVTMENGSARRERTNYKKLPDGLYLECKECGEHCEFKPLPKEHRENVPIHKTPPQNETGDAMIYGHDNQKSEASIAAMLIIPDSEAKWMTSEELNECMKINAARLLALHALTWHNYCLRLDRFLQW